MRYLYSPLILNNFYKKKNYFENFIKLNYEDLQH